MKKILLFIALMPFISFGQGVSWLKNGNLKTVFDIAQSQNKNVLIEVFSPTCHVCQSFMPVFEENSVGNAFNSGYVSYKLDINSQEAQAFLSKQNLWIPSLPMLLYFDKKVNLQHISILGEGQNQAQTLVNSVGVANDSSKRLTSFAARFSNGNKEPNFLIDFGYMAKIKKDTITSIRVMEEYAKGQKGNLDNQTNFLVLQKIIFDSENLLYKNMMANLGQYQKKYTAKAVTQVAENIIMSSLYSSRAINFSSEKINNLANDMKKVGIDSKSVENRTLLPEINVYFKANQANLAIARIEKFIKLAAPSPKEYEFLGNLVKQKTSDKAALAKANEWLKKAK